ncbi:MAG: sigma-70 family RNA polymerase sigma factor [Prevotella sp.]|nr:sigma-70 family RNA polymerase sigma factor [Prevotella sp.]
MDPETTELISRCKAGERQALDLLYQQYRPKLLNICKHYAKEDVVAEDLLHDAFVVILTSLDKLEQTDKPEPWMTAIVKNVCHHYQLHVKKEQATLRQMAKEGWPSAEEIPVPDYDEIQAFISQLPQDYQRLFRLSVFEGLSHKEISQLLGITPNSSSKRLSNAKRMLRLLIRQSWVLMLLLVAIPTAVWWLFHKQVSTDEQTLVVSQDTSKPQITTSAEKPEKPPVYTQASSSSPSPSPSIRRSKGIKTGWIPQQPAHHPNEVSILPDSVPRLVNDSMTVLPTKTAQTKEEEVLKDTIIYPPTLWQPDGNQIAIYPTKAHQQWNVSLAYNGQMGRGEDFMAAATIENNFSME